MFNFSISLSRWTKKRLAAELCLDPLGLPKSSGSEFRGKGSGSLRPVPPIDGCTKDYNSVFNFYLKDCTCLSSYEIPKIYIYDIYGNISTALATLPIH